MDKFVEGGLYWHEREGFVECTQKIEDVTVLHTLLSRKKLVALDGDKEYTEVLREDIDNEIDDYQKDLGNLKQEVRDTEAYIGKLKYGRWANMETPVATDPVNGLQWVDKGPIDGGGWKNADTTKGVLINVAVSEKDFAKMNRKALRNVSVFNTDTAKITEYAEDGTVKAVYEPKGHDIGWADSCDACKHETGEEME